MEFMPEIERFISDYCKWFGVSRKVFLENLLIDQLARIAVREMMQMSYNPIPQFIGIEVWEPGEKGEAIRHKGVLRGKQLYENLIDYYMAEAGETQIITQEEYKRYLEKRKAMENGKDEQKE